MLWVHEVLKKVAFIFGVGYERCRVVIACTPDDQRLMRCLLLLVGCASAQLVYRLLRTRDGGTRVDLFLASARPQFACLLSCFWFWASLRVVVERASDRLDGVVEAGVLCAIALVAYSILLEVEAAANRRAHEFIRHEKCHPNFLQKMKLVDSVSRSGNPIQVRREREIVALSLSLSLSRLPHTTTPTLRTLSGTPRARRTTA